MRWLPFLLLAACGAPTARQFVGPDGARDWWRVRGGDRGELLQMAGQRCPTGYTILEQGGGLTVRCHGTSAPPPPVEEKCLGEYHLHGCYEQWMRHWHWTETPPEQ